MGRTIPPAARLARSDRPLSRGSRVKLAIHRGLDRWLSPLGVWVMRRTKGGVAGPWKVNALLMSTTGRRSGRRRTVVLQYFPDGEAMVVVAANDGGASYPGWYFNLTANPEALVEVNGTLIPVRAEELDAEAAATWWGRILDAAPDYAWYRSATSRRFPILRLTPALPGGPSDMAEGGDG